MRFNIKDLYAPEQVTGPRDREFCDIIVGGDRAGEGTLFIHLEGTYMEDKQKILRAYEEGCRLFVASSFPEELEADPYVTRVRVSEPAGELQRLAKVCRDLSPAKVIAITGSSGKTTTKDMIAHILRQKYKRTLKTYRNYNGALGVALTLRKLYPDDQYAVVEIGLGAHGSVGRGAELARPDIGVITNIGDSHLALFGTRDNIAREKGALLDHVAPGGPVFLNGDDPRCRRLADKAKGPVTFYGLRDVNGIRAEAFEQGLDGMRVTIKHQGLSQRFEVPIVGAFQVYNLLASVGVGLAEGFSLEEMAKRVKTFAPLEQRLRPIRVGGFLLLDDGYNSNPYALRSSLSALNSLPIPANKQIAVIGDMQDMGRHNRKYYLALQKMLTDYSFKAVVFIGPKVEQLTATTPNSVSVSTPREAAETVLRLAEPGSAVLLKGQDDPLFRAIRDEIMIRIGEKLV